MYKVELSKQAKKFMKRLPEFVVNSFVKKFTQLAENPYTMTGIDTIKNPKSIGIEAEYVYRISVEDYRATYTIEDDTITI